MLYFYYRKSIDKMVLQNTEPEEDWYKYGRGGNCEIYIHGKVTIENGFATLVPSGEEQNLVHYALRIDPIGENGDEYDE